MIQCEGVKDFLWLNLWEDERSDIAHFRHILYNNMKTKKISPDPFIKSGRISAYLKFSRSTIMKNILFIMDKLFFYLLQYRVL